MNRKLPKRLLAAVAPMVAALGMLAAMALPASSASLQAAPAVASAVQAAPVAAPQVAMPSYFDTSYCNGWWVYASTWGRGCFVDGVGVVQDLRSDGYCVEAKYKDMYGRWLRAYDSTDCAGGAGNVFTVPKDPRTGSSYHNVRIYRGDGYYKTLSW